MSEFYDLLEEYLGSEDDGNADIRVCVRRLYFYDFLDNPLRIWQGKGRLFTPDNHEWLGTIDAQDNDIHLTPAMQDGRDGSSATYNMGLVIPDLPDENAFDLFQALKSEQLLAKDRKITVYLAIFKEGEALRPTTPYVFFKELLMSVPQFSEKLVSENGQLVKQYKVTIPTKDNNLGRSYTPRRSYADTMQKQHARELGVSVDKGAEYLALLANRTYQIP